MAASPVGDEDAEIPWVAIMVVLMALLPLLAIGVAATQGGRGDAG